MALFCKWKCEPFSDAFGYLWLKRGNDFKLYGGYRIDRNDSGNLFDFEKITSGNNHYLRASWKSRTLPNAGVCYLLFKNDKITMGNKIDNMDQRIHFTGTVVEGRPFLKLDSMYYIARPYFKTLKMLLNKQHRAVSSDVYMRVKC